MRCHFRCSDSIIGIFSAIYDAWQLRNKDMDLGIAIGTMSQPELFCDYRLVEESERKSIAIERLIKRHLGLESYLDIYYAALTPDHEKGTAILQTMLQARYLQNSQKILHQLSNPCVEKVFELSRKAKNEAYFHREILRFRELSNGVLLSEIVPESQILPCIGDHFANRFPLENWMIYDQTHRSCLIHKKQMPWVQLLDVDLQETIKGDVSTSEEDYQELWKLFFRTIAIESRENPLCQRNHLPIKYRRFMPEFQE